MALPNSSSHPYKIYVTAQPHNFFKDDQSLESPLIRFKCNIKMSYVPDKLPFDKPKSNIINRIGFLGKRKSDPEESRLIIEPFIAGHDSWHEFEHPAKDLTRDFLSTTLFTNNTIRFPFELTNLHWKKQVQDQDKESIPVMSTDELVTSMLQVCDSMARRSPNRKKLNLIVSVKKIVTVPYEEYLAMLKAEKQQQVLEQVAEMVRHGRGHGDSSNIRIPRREWENMSTAIREVGLGNSISDALNIMRQRAIRESTSREVIRVVPAAATSIQALEKVTLSNTEQEEEEIKCIFCMEEMEKGCE
ncbi:hypothetical protein CCACVL1_09374, partial [Corchorus capsularis]